MDVPIDIADAIQEALNAAGHNACAPPLPDGFEDSLPMTRVTGLGGPRSSRVVDTFNVHLDTWADTPAGALAEAGEVVGLLAGMAGGLLGGSQCYRVDIGSLPHEDEDPDHPDLPMASAMAQVSVRARHTG